ncbi:MAG TPA: hydrogen gas-evolving membrane-bound hydrogenase subunit E [Flavobacterium sp.]|nr:hydrogen gas-evolving membrane-bound hydrogenase subunit E [Flavobacterium sp.]
MLFPLLLVFIIAFALLLTKRFSQSKFYRIISVLPLGLFAYFLSFLPIVSDGKKTVFFSNSWIPQLGISLDFKIDGLSLLFALLITGIGTLVYLYSSSYLKGNPLLYRFYSYLTMFMGAMLGVVLSDNIITLFIFWELTSISSFFLIGFNNEEEESRNSAMWALSLTGLGGFFLLVSFVLIGTVAGTYSITELLNHSTDLIESQYYYMIIGLMFVGAFTKSAQFPFHFWLPGAMKAPTPVSAYLHSATMVKAGIYILARFSPILSDGWVWNGTLMIVGGMTMSVAAYISLFKRDMKGILAYSTISALGLLVFFIGIGTETALFAAVTFILVHALYKATFFLSTGIVDHAVHTRDIRLISGMGKVMPFVAIAVFIAALSSAGIPLTFGFISKELFYESVFGSNLFYTWGIYALLALLLLTNAFIGTSGFMVGFKPFLGSLSHQKKDIHTPDFYLWLPPVLLSILTLTFGVLPSLADVGIIASATKSALERTVEQHLALWHGFSPVLLISLVTIFLAFLVYMLILKKISNKSNLEEKLHSLEKYSSKAVMTTIAVGIKKFAFRYTRFFHNGYLRIYLLMIISFTTLIVGYKLFTDVDLKVNTDGLSAFRIYEFTVFVLILIAIAFIMITRSRLTAILGTGVVGYCICMIFVFYGAPDIAITQFVIDTLTVVLFVLVLSKLPSFLGYSNRKVIIRDAIVAGCFGILMSMLTLQALVYPSDKSVSNFYAENAYVVAKGKNVVNVILVDYRGFDTMIETIVLAIAAVGVFSILKYKIQDGER